MNISYVDFIAFGAFLTVVVGVSLYAGRRERSTEDYFSRGPQLDVVAHRDLAHRLEHLDGTLLVMSSFNSMLNSASTIFTMDLYARHFQPKARAEKLVRVGRIATAAFAVIACSWAPFISRFEGVFTYIQMGMGLHHARHRRGLLVRDGCEESACDRGSWGVVAEPASLRTAPLESSRRRVSAPYVDHFSRADCVNGGG